jgi:protein subunit release factor A
MASRLLTAPRGARRLLPPLLPRPPPGAAAHLATRPTPPPPPPPLWYSEAELEEQFVRGGGRGGQSVAKTNNCVILKHVPSGTQVRCHATRSCETNRRLARKELQLRLDELHRGTESVRSVRE